MCEVALVPPSPRGPGATGHLMKGDFMPRETKSENGERLIDRMVILVTPEFKKNYLAMCEGHGLNASEHIRTLLEDDLENA